MYQKLTLKNNLRLITAPLVETQAVTVLVLVGVGSRYEDKKLSGTSHFIEHLLFKGTKKRPNTLTISRQLDSLGADYNAFTTKDHTGYYVKIAADKIELALDILADMLWNSKFEAPELEREKQVIIEEINMYEDNPLIYLEDLFEQALFAPGSLSRRISGTRQTIKEVSRAEVFDFKNKFYQPRNIIVSVAGKVPSEIEKLVSKYFAKNVSTQREIKKFSKFKLQGARSLAQRFQLKKQETEQVQLGLGFPGYSYFHKDIYALYLLALILGGNMSSRLFIEVREKRGLAYFVRCHLNIYQDTGCLIIQAGLDKIRLEQAMRLILAQLKKIKAQKVNISELKRAQDFLAGKITLELEDSMHLAEWFAKQELLTGQILTPQQKIQKILTVKPSDIQRVANQVIKNNHLAAALIGPFSNKNKFFNFLQF